MLMVGSVTRWRVCLSTRNRKKIHSQIKQIQTGCPWQSGGCCQMQTLNERLWKASYECIRGKLFLIGILRHSEILFKKQIKIEILWSSLRHILAQTLLKKWKKSNLECCLSDCTVGSWNHSCPFISPSASSALWFTTLNMHPDLKKIKSKVPHAWKAQIKKRWDANSSAFKLY